ncbi:putative malate dehydrogenase [Helianthus anomalus]
MVLAFTTSKLWREGHCWRELIAEQRKGATRVAILDTVRGIGQPLAILTKMNLLYDVVNVPGVTANVSHMDTRVVVH